MNTLPELEKLVMRERTINAMVALFQKLYDDGLEEIGRLTFDDATRYGRFLADYIVDGKSPWFDQK